MHGAASQHVHVEVRDGLSPVGAYVQDRAVPVFGETLLTSDLTRSEEDRSQEAPVVDPDGLQR